MRGQGSWVQARLADGRELRGRVIAGLFGTFRFGTREVVELNEAGEPFEHLGRIPPSEQIVEVFMETRAPAILHDRLRAFVEHLDSLGRRVVVKADDDLVRWCEHRTLWRWRALRWFRSLFQVVCTV